MSADCAGNSTCPVNSTEEDPPVGMEGHANLKLLFTVLSAVMVGLVMFSFGCSVESQKLWVHLRRPWGIAVGLLSQFGLMPLTAYLLAIGFGLKPFQAIAVLMMGSCPGGTISNVLTFWVDGDMDLSISMTTCSTVAALGMMPLCLYIYTRSWTQTQNLVIPYQSIGITLVSMVVPVASGIYVNYRWPKQATVILKVGAVLGGMLLLVVAVTGMVLAKGWNTDVTLLVISCIFPLVGHVTGFLLAFLTHQSWQRCRTISIETGAQNIQLCIAMLQLSFSAEYLVQLLNFALAYGLFQVLHGLLIVAAYQAYKRRQKSKCRRQHPDCPDVCYEKQPRETSAFLDKGDEAAVTLGPVQPEEHHRAAELTSHIPSCE
ncbi:solute carrier family 10 member 6 [Mus caroli]|uniref:Solute carrier family 10 member 6 n=1 Tax=Mus caroli TaxID=10089 RepID=A0A6P5PTJ5_MUSCR|nr:solute carrier family 10 member 6 [Mus caroli]